MKHRISTSILIKAPKQIVWEVLTDFANYTLWNPFIKSASGKLKKGDTLIIHIHPPQGSPMKFNPKVLELERGTSFS